jgi:monovalent cation/proton antiporter MnhG/PhaG subunit
MAHPILTSLLLGLAVALALICSIGIAVVRDTYQRIHFSAPIVAISMPLISVAVFLEEPDSQARIKAVAITVLLIVMNAVLGHATARAIYIRETGRWPDKPQAEPDRPEKQK